VIIGPMGSGKTTLGRRLAESLHRRFLDSDLQIGEMTGRTGREIAAVDGVDELHRLERAVLLDGLAMTEPVVIAAAASVVDDEMARARLGETFCVLVTADPAVLAERVTRGGHRRQVSRFEHLERRDPLFREVADLVIDTGALAPEEALQQALAAMSAA
jgi:shikimate kinase